MKLYIVSDNMAVTKRWAQMLTGNEVQELNSDLLSKGSLNLGSACGLVHLSSVSSHCIDTLSSSYPMINWIGFADYPLDDEGLEVLKKGFKGYINTYVTNSLLKELLKVVARNDIWAGPSITQKMLKLFLNSASASIANVVESAPKFNYIEKYSLTTREAEVAEALLTGAANKEIAIELGITERTIKAHVASILHKTDTKDRLALIIKLSKQ